MKLLLLAISAFLSALLWHGGASAQTSGRDPLRDPKGDWKDLLVITPDLIKELQAKYRAYMAFRNALLVKVPSPPPCTLVGNICPIPIQLALIQDDDGKTFCVGLVQEVIRLSDTRVGNTPKRIVWRLLPPGNATGDDEFFFYGEDDRGITWLSNIGTGADRQLRDGKLGDGSIGTGDRTKWVVWNLHQATGEAVYVPLILQKNTATQKISLCGTPDPRMVND